MTAVYSVRAALLYADADYLVQLRKASGDVNKADAVADDGDRRH